MDRFNQLDSIVQDLNDKDAIKDDELKRIKDYKESLFLKLNQVNEYVITRRQAQRYKARDAFLNPVYYYTNQIGMILSEARYRIHEDHSFKGASKQAESLETSKQEMFNALDAVSKNNDSQAAFKRLLVELDAYNKAVNRIVDAVDGFERDQIDFDSAEYNNLVQKVKKAQNGDERSSVFAKRFRHTISQYHNHLLEKVYQKESDSNYIMDNRVLPPFYEKLRHAQYINRRLQTVAENGIKAAKDQDPLSRIDVYMENTNELMNEMRRFAFKAPERINTLENIHKAYQAYLTSTMEHLTDARGLYDLSRLANKSQSIRSKLNKQVSLINKTEVANSGRQIIDQILSTNKAMQKKLKNFEHQSKYKVRQ